MFACLFGNTPGCAVAIVDGGTVAYSNGYGVADLNTEIPITPSSVFFTAGASGGIVATLALMLVEEQRLDLDQDIHAYIPELPAYGAK